MADIPPPSKNQRRKQKKAHWIAKRKSNQIAESLAVSTRRRRNQRHHRTVDNVTPSAAVHYQVCSSATCNNRLAGNDCVVRCIQPYVHRFALFCKGRWAGRTLRELFADEFPTLSTDYCARAAQSGLVRLNRHEARLDTVMKAQDFFEHIKHRHEPCVHLPVPRASTLSTTSLSTKWIQWETDEWMVVDKPSGIPVHPTGSFQFNSLTRMLQHDRREMTGETNAQTLELFPVHRLDRLTSGLLILAKTVEKARILTAELTATSLSGGIGSRAVQKYYVARVAGEFPTTLSGFAEVNGLRSGLVTIESTRDDFWHVAAPIGFMSPRQGHKRCVITSSDSKPCVTLLRRRGNPAGGESIVECLLGTGRTHQIRVHLQHLGFPIVNDPLYRPANNDKRSKGSSQQGLKKLHEAVESFDHTKSIREDIEHQCIRVCEFCTTDNEKRAAGASEDAVLWLHSYRYESPNWSFTVPLPQWTRLHECE